MRTLAITGAALLGLMFCGTPAAEAGGFQFSIGQYGGYGNPGYGWGNGYYGNRNFRRGHYHYHDTSHYDYVPGHVVPHGNHLHYVPGRYYFHQDGHYDYHRGGHHRHHHH